MMWSWFFHTCGSVETFSFKLHYKLIHVLITFRNVHEYFLKILLCARGSHLISGAALYLGLYSSVEVYVLVSGQAVCLNIHRV